jgi:hypothetical protein
LFSENVKYLGGAETVYLVSNFSAVNNFSSGFHASNSGTVLIILEILC